MERVFFTGFPGFLGSELLPRVLRRMPGAEATCLVQPKYADLARRRANDLMLREPAFRGRIGIVEGDVALPDMGIRLLRDALRETTTEIYHLAAIYDLAVRRDLAMRVNVDGTRHVLGFARVCANLHRLHYMSTCYVSGRHEGLFTENDASRGGQFNNFYEESKFIAEEEVHRVMRAGLPATIYRPSITVGDSRTGLTQKYDGPYSVIRWLLRQPKLALMPMVGDGTPEVNVVPRDFVVDAMAYLGGRPESEGRTYHLADPAPLNVRSFVAALGRATGRRLVKVPLSPAVAKYAIEKVPGVYALMQIPSPAIDYFLVPTRYGTAETTRALEGSGIVCPRFTDYADRLVAFVRANPKLSSAAMA